MCVLPKLKPIYAVKIKLKVDVFVLPRKENKVEKG